MEILFSIYATLLIFCSFAWAVLKLRGDTADEIKWYHVFYFFFYFVLFPILAVVDKFKKK